MRDVDGVEAFKVELYNLREKYNNLKVAKAKLADELHAARDKIDDLAKANSSSKSQRYMALEGQIQELRGQIADRERSSILHDTAQENGVKSLREELKNARESEKAVEARLTANERRTAAMTERESNLSSELAFARGEMQLAAQRRDASPQGDSEVRKQLALVQQALVSRDRLLRQRDREICRLSEDGECHTRPCDQNRIENLKELTEQLRMELSESHSQISVAENRLGAAQVENLKLRSCLSESQEQLQVANSLLGEAQVDNLRIRKETDSYEVAGLTPELDSSIAQLREDLKVARAETQTLRERDALRGRSPDSELRSEVKLLRAQLENKSRQLRTEEKNNVLRAKESLARISSDVSAVEEEASAQALQCRSLENRVETLQAEVVTEVQSSFRSEENAARAVERVRRAGEENVADARREEAQQVRQEISKAEMSLRTAVESESTQLDQAIRHAQLQSMQGEELREELSSSQELVAILRTKLAEENRDQQLAQLIEVVTAQDAENRKLREGIDEQAKVAGDLAQKRDDKDREVAVLRTDLAHAESLVQHEQQRLFELTDVAAAKDREVLRLQKDLVALTEQVDSCEVRRLSDDQILMAKDEQVIQLRNEIKVRDAEILGCKAAMDGALREKEDLVTLQASLTERCEYLVKAQESLRSRSASPERQVGGPRAEEQEQLGKEENLELRRLFSSLEHLEKLVEKSVKEKHQTIQLRKRVAELESQVLVGAAQFPELLEVKPMVNTLISQDVGVIALDQLVSLKTRIIEARHSMLHDQSPTLVASAASSAASTIVPTPSLTPIATASLPTAQPMTDDRPNFEILVEQMQTPPQQPMRDNLLEQLMVSFAEQPMPSVKPLHCFHGLAAQAPCFQSPIVQPRSLAVSDGISAVQRRSHTQHPAQNASTTSPVVSHRSTTSPLSQLRDSRQGTPPVPVPQRMTTLVRPSSWAPLQSKAGPLRLDTKGAVGVGAGGRQISPMCRMR